MTYWLECTDCGEHCFERSENLFGDGEVQHCPGCGALVRVTCDAESPAELRVDECGGEVVRRLLRTSVELAAEAHAARDAVERLTKERDDAVENLAQASKVWDGPETDDWFAGVRKEAAHQVCRWGVGHDGGKTPFDWFWLVGYLAQKAADAAVHGDLEKARHHTISTAASLLLWHAQLAGRASQFRPGISPPAETQDRPRVIYAGEEWFYGGPDNDACTSHRVYRLDDDGELDCEVHVSTDEISEADRCPSR